MRKNKNLFYFKINKNTSIGITFGVKLSKRTGVFQFYHNLKKYYL